MARGSTRLAAAAVAAAALGVCAPALAQKPAATAEAAPAPSGPADGPGVVAIDFTVLLYDVTDNSFAPTAQFDEGAQIAAAANRPIWPILIGVELTMDAGDDPAFRYPVELVITTDGEEVFREARWVHYPNPVDRMFVPFLVDMNVCGVHEIAATWLGDASRATRVRRVSGECGE